VGYQLSSVKQVIELKETYDNKDRKSTNRLRYPWGIGSSIGSNKYFLV